MAVITTGNVPKAIQGSDRMSLSAAARRAMPRSDFALPGKGSGPEGKGAGSYPIPNASHARNALARVSQHGSSEEKAEVRSAVKRKFPGIKQQAMHNDGGCAHHAGCETAYP